ncbi:aminotransferase class IV [Candidatus Micrarchaeota archaeon]|nr:aminotransferase class IV [Candidatus Micrarchaeota archaeon]
MNESIVCLNGELKKAREARISVLDEGFTRGYALFETMRAYSGKVFKLDRHLQRLQESGKKVKLSIPPSLRLEQLIAKTLEANNLQDARVKVIVSRGVEGVNSPTLAIFASPLELDEAIYSNGLKCASAKRALPNSRVKTTNYLFNLLALKEAKENGFDDVLLLDENSLVCEGATANVFAVFDGELATPSLELGILPGITRETVMEIAGALGLKTSVKNYSLKELFTAREAFLASSVREIASIISVDGKKIGSGKPGEVAKKIHVEYKKMAGA